MSLLSKQPSGCVLEPNIITVHKAKAEAYQRNNHFIYKKASQVPCCVCDFASANIQYASICIKKGIFFHSQRVFCVWKIQTYRDANSMTFKRRTPIFQSWIIALVLLKRGKHRGVGHSVSGRRLDSVVEWKVESESITILFCFSLLFCKLFYLEAESKQEKWENVLKTQVIVRKTSHTKLFIPHGAKNMIFQIKLFTQLFYYI